MIKLIPTLIAALALAVLAPAQGLPVTICGKVVTAPGNPCDPTATHAIECSDVLLMSSHQVDLTKYEGQVVDIRGQLAASLTCQVVDVETIAIATVKTSTLALFGTGLGRTVLMTTTAPLGTVVPIIFSGNRGFLPLGPFGTYFLDLATSIYVGFDLSIGVAVHREVIPNSPSLIGVVIYYQTIALQITGQAGVKILNPNCFTITQ